MKKLLRTGVEWLGLLVAALLLTLLIRTFVIDNRIVPTGSMLPTIQLNDRLFVDKLFYKMQGIDRGDIIVFHAPENVTEEKDMVKRVIGLPGETLEIKGGLVYINEQALNEPYVAEAPNYTFGPVAIPEEAYFVMGDNRNRSLDSHVWGFLADSYITGRIWVRYYPFSAFGKLTEPPTDYFLSAGLAP
ncbi:MAG: signal peptidase I [Gracilibacteraceae bacterium]|nr:signal peptidase I [Gracilibacteraceae bacterium]